MTCVNCGDRPATLNMGKSKEYATEAGRVIDPQTTKKIEKGGYVDNNICGGTKAKMKNMIIKVTDKDGDLFFFGTLAQIFYQSRHESQGNGQNWRDRFGGTVIGYNWDVWNNKIVFKLVLNLNQKQHGICTGEDPTPEKWMGSSLRPNSC